MKLFKVHARMESGERMLAGDLVLDTPRANGEYRAAFRYAPSWLAHPLAFALDPESLPLGSGEFSGARLGPPLGAIDDALPDRWGRDLLLRNLPRSQRTDQALVAARGANGLGALEFDHPAAPSQETSSASLDALLAAAEAFEAGREVADADLRRLLAAGTTAGGARPKATVSDDGDHWIAKFPSKVLDGRFDIVGLEKASMDCAQAAGLVTPETRIQEVGARRVLLVRRFDTTAHGRRHMLSFATLCRERNDFKATHYDQLAAALRRVSGEPARDVAQLFRQAIFNGLLGNTDDHLKNFAVYRDRGEFRLTPAYDLLPDVGRNEESVLFFGATRTLDSMATIDALAKRWGVVGHRAIVEQVVAAVRDFSRHATAVRVPVANVDEIGADITRRLARIGVS